MIIGTCPWDDCDEPLTRYVVDGIALERHACEKCERVVWTMLSRVDPWSMTDDDFSRDFEMEGRTPRWRGDGVAPYPFK